MKNLTKLSLAVTAASLLMASAAQANDVQLLGQVHPVCEISGLPTEIDFGYNPVNGTSDHSDIWVQCNEKAGATIEITSLNGGLALEGEDDQDAKFAGNYSDVLTVSITAE